MQSTEEKLTQAMEQGTGVKKPNTLIQRAKQQGNLEGFNQGEVSKFLETMKGRVAQVLPKHLTAERILQMAAMNITRTPALAKCTVPSLLGAIMQASVLGFPPVDTLGYCYFIPYSGQVQFQIGYKGLVELARRSGAIQSVYAEVVREGDDFHVAYGLEPRLDHIPRLDNSRPLTHVYAVAKFTNGGYNFVVLSRADVERLRLFSPNQRGAATPQGVWGAHYDAMAKGKALKQLAKYLPLNLDQQQAIAADEVVIHTDNFQDGELKIEEVSYEE